MQHAEAQVFALESAAHSLREVREHIEATAGAIAGSDDVHIRKAMDGVRWERRGLLGRLSRYDDNVA